METSFASRLLIFAAAAGVAFVFAAPVPRAGAADDAKRAVAVLHPTAGHGARGVVHFTANADGTLEVKSELSGLAPGVHAYHVHVYGDCSAPDGKSAGEHFAFASEDPSQHITGDLGELTADASGNARHTGRVERASGLDAIVGRAVVVHEHGNDPSQPPDGDAGARVACGVIGVAPAGPSQARR